MSLIKQAICALFAASATRQKSLLLPWLGSCPYCCVCPGCCWDCCWDCGCASECEVGACDCGKEVDVRCRRCGCEGKYEGWLAEGEGKGAEDEEYVPEVFEEAMEVKVDSSGFALYRWSVAGRLELARTLSKPDLVAEGRHAGGCEWQTVYASIMCVLWDSGNLRVR